jgi:hypothetical protein
MSVDDLLDVHAGDTFRWESADHPDDAPTVSLQRMNRYNGREITLNSDTADELFCEIFNIGNQLFGVFVDSTTILAKKKG